MKPSSQFVAALHDVYVEPLLSLCATCSAARLFILVFVVVGVARLRSLCPTTRYVLLSEYAPTLSFCDGVAELVAPLAGTLKLVSKACDGTWNDALKVVHMSARLALQRVSRDIVHRRSALQVGGQAPCAFAACARAWSMELHRVVVVVTALQLQDDVRKVKPLKLMEPLFDMNFNPEKAETDKQKVRRHAPV